MSQEIPTNPSPEGFKPPEYFSPGYNSYAPVPPSLPQYPAPPLPRGRRRGRWITAGILVFLLIVLIPTFFFVRYITRSTPDKTLDTFCTALQQGDYQTAYDQFSPRFQRTISETAFTAIFSQDKVSACTHSTSNDAGISVTNTLKLVHISKGINNDVVTLTKESNDTWEIDDIYRQ